MRIDSMLEVIKKMRDRYYRHKVRNDYFSRILRQELSGMDSVLDVGCGSESRLQFVEGIGRKIGVDAFEPSVAKARAKGIHDEYIIMPLDRLDLPDGSYDAVILLDLIEHFTKEEGRVFLKRIEKIARRKVLVFTPNGFLPQPAYGNNPWQEHKCGWVTREFQELGYRVMGIMGWNKLLGIYHLSVIRPRFFGEWICNLTRALWTGANPEKDAALLAVKELE